MQTRVKRLQEIVKKEKIQGLIIARDSDVRYLSGVKFDVGSTMIVLAGDEAFIITDGRYQNELERNCRDFIPIIYDPQKGLHGEAEAVLRSRNIHAAATEYSSVSHAAFLALTASDIQISDSKPYPADMRMVKDHEELLLIRQACAISDASFEAAVGNIRPGITERDVANMLEVEFKKRGGDGLAFDTIIASGPENGANCHAEVSERKLEKGDSVTLDFGTTYNGYCSDISRTVFLGTPTQEQVKLYQTVKEAKKRAAEALREGARLKDIAATGIGYIKQCGYTVPHGIGHSFGYDAHEPLFISVRDERQLKADMVTTLEPGIYIPGIGGVRLEDDYIITADGAEQITHCTDEMLVL